MYYIKISTKNGWQTVEELPSDTGKQRAAACARYKTYATTFKGLFALSSYPCAAWETEKQSRNTQTILNMLPVDNSTVVTAVKHQFDLDLSNVSKGPTGTMLVTSKKGYQYVITTWQSGLIVVSEFEPVPVLNSAGLRDGTAYKLLKEQYFMDGCWTDDYQGILTTEPIN